MAITELSPALSVTCEAIYVPFVDGAAVDNASEFQQLVCDVIFQPNTKEDGVILVAGTAKGIIANTFTFRNVGDPAGTYPWPFDEQIVNLADTDLNPSGANYTVIIKPKGYVSAANTVVPLEGWADRVGVLVCESGMTTTPLLQWLPLDSASDGAAYLIGRPGPIAEWDTLLNKPDVIAAGATADDARTAIGAAPALGTDDNYVTDAEKIKLANLSGTNTGDQDLPTWSTLTGKPATFPPATHNHDDRYFTEDEVATLLAGKAASLSADDNYVTDAEKTKLANLSGTNTGDQDLSGYVQTTNAPELIRDTIGSTLVAGSNVTITPDDANDTITIEVPGISLARNLVVNGDFSNGTTGWTVASGTPVTVTNGEATFTATAQYGRFSGSSIPIATGEKFYQAGRIKANVTATNQIAVGVASSVAPVAIASIGTDWQLVSAVGTASTNMTVGALVIDYRTSGWDAITVDNIIVINLTATFGAGQEPTKTEMDYLLSKYPNSWFNGTVNDLTRYYDPMNRVGKGSPHSVITPRVKGEMWTDLDQTNGARKWVSTGATNTSWVVTDGDTGWRRLVGWTDGTLDYGELPNGVGPLPGITGGIFIRRIGMNITYRIAGALTTAANQVWPIPTGWAPLSPYAGFVIPFNEAGVNKTTFAAGGALTFTSIIPSGCRVPALSLIPVDFSWIADRERWPTTLPGTPA